ncbi:glutaryl dehydrogenase [Fusarium sp. NRRL 52700]|nr:glutaryl dehydrogenase [Fusarium sp. NRRL 52700]
MSLFSCQRRLIAKAVTEPSTSLFRCASTRGPFQWQDPLNMQEVLTDEERILDVHRLENYDRKILEEMGELGLLDPTIDGYGCAGVSSVAAGLITLQSSLVMGPIEKHGSQEQKYRWLEKLARGKLVGCFGLTEPNFGSDPGSLETTAVPHPTKKDAYILNGVKTWITNSPIADILLVWAKLDGTIRGFMPAIKDKNVLRASITGMIQMDGCVVLAANMLPNVTGLKGPFSCLNLARYGIAWGTIGALEDCLDCKKLAVALIDAAFGLQAALQVGCLKDKGLVAPEMILMIKRQNCDCALSGACTLQEVSGGNAASGEYHIGRHVTKLFVTQTYEGQSDVHALILGRSITGLQAFF